MSAPVFLVGDGSLARLRPGERYLLGGAEGRHARVVHRLTPPEPVELCDGLGLRLRCLVVSDVGSGAPAKSAPDALPVLVREVVREPPPAPILTLVQALAKGERGEQAVATAIETGADEIVPWQAQRSIVVWRGERGGKARARWVATVHAAVKQTRRAWVPPVASLVRTPALATLVAETVEAGGAALVLHETAPVSILGTQLPKAAVRILVVVGPEGGITDEELTRLQAAGARVVRLGPDIMRTSTAGPVALAVLSARLGRWDL